MNKYSQHARYEYSGEEVPSVTTIISILNKPGLSKWANIMGFKRQRTEDILLKAGTIGTAVHGCIEAWLMEEGPFILTDEMNQYRGEVAQRMDSFLTWAKGQELVLEKVEEKLVCDRYGGTVDYVGILNGERMILDFKTSSRVYSSMFLQLAAYCQILEKNPNEDFDSVGIVHIRPEATKVVKVSREELEKYIETFNVLVDLFHKWFDINMDGWSNILEK